jgi:hypothetical protein
VSGFSKARVDHYQEGLEDLRDGIGRMGPISAAYGLIGMKIEYVEGVFENKPKVKKGNIAFISNNVLLKLQKF